MRAPIERLMAKVEPEPNTGCWLWTAHLNHDDIGYGRMKVAGRHVLAHRFAYEQLVGPVPQGLQLDHLCRVRSCVNPRHLEPVTQAVNVRRGVSFAAAEARRVHCPSGHPYDHLNTDGARCCRVCRREQNKSYRARKRAQAA